MRLTLRTLLAYMDNVLDRQHAEELQEKIAASSNASRLVHRIRNTIGQLRLDAPEVDATGVGADANSVAEYLDNTLPLGSLPEFERICLDSDAHLSEVASCHQILTLVLGSPAHVDVSVRERIHGLPYRKQSGLPDQSPVVSRVLPSRTDQRDLRLDMPIRSLPQTNPEPESRPASRVPLLMMLALATGFIMVVVGLRGLGPFDQNHPLLQWYQGMPIAQQSDGNEPFPKIYEGNDVADSSDTSSRNAHSGHTSADGLADLTLDDSTEMEDHSLDTTVSHMDQDSDAEAALPEPTNDVFTGPANLRETRDDIELAANDTVANSLADNETNSETAAADASFDWGNTTVNDPLVDNADPSETVDSDISLENTLPAEDASELVLLDEPSGLIDSAAENFAARDEEDFQEAVTPPLVTDTTEILPPAPDNGVPPLDTRIPADLTEDALADSANTELVGLPPIGSELASNTPPPPPTPAAQLTQEPLGVDDRLARSEERPSIPLPTIGRNQNDLRQPASDQLPDSDDPLAAIENVANYSDLADDVAAQEEEAVFEPIAEIAKLISSNQVAGVVAQDNQDWMRLADGDVVAPESRLMALPSYRPELKLVNNARITLSGPSLVTINQLNSSEPTPELEFDYGKAVMSARECQQQSIHVRWPGDHTAAIEFVDQDSVAAIEVARARIPGTDPESEPARLLCKVFALSGNITVHRPDTDSVQVPAGQVLVMLDGVAVRTRDIDSYPKWVSGKDVTPLDHQAHTWLTNRLTEDRPLLVSLRENLGSQKKEVRTLAACSLAYMGECDAVVEALNDNTLYAYWDGHLETIDNVLGQGPELAAKIREAVQNVLGEQAAPLFRSLWGYSNEQLAAGAAITIAENLNHRELMYRVVANHIFRTVTGKNPLYRPESSVRSRQIAVVRWKARADEIRYAELPEVVQLLSE
ncbi:MAG: hypothetical protein KDA87_04145 [Planctomycetales bacterium]|nr:hypothetical protein [Planctomycetales bacterium]